MPNINQKTVNAVPYRRLQGKKQDNLVLRVEAALDTTDRVGKAISLAETAVGGRFAALSGRRSGVNSSRVRLGPRSPLRESADRAADRGSRISSWQRVAALPAIREGVD